METKQPRYMYMHMHMCMHMRMYTIELQDSDTPKVGGSERRLVSCVDVVALNLFHGRTS